MKNKILFITFLIFTLFTPLRSQDDWSSARQLSRDGVGPYLFMGVPAITVDSSGTIHAFWVISPSEDGSVTNRYSQIEHRRSADGGKTWTPTENLTSEYTTERIYYMKAVCDSKNNVHLVYMRGYEALKVMYKEYDGLSWSEPVQIGVGSSYLRMGIDTDDRIYVTWMIGREAFFNYKDGDTWAEYTQIGTGEYGIDDFKFKRNSILISAGTCWTGGAKPYYFDYDKNLESWTTIEKIPCDADSSAGGKAISVSNKDTMYICYTEGSWIDKNDGVFISKPSYSNEYTTPYKYGNNNNPDGEMFIDSYDYLHLFELHYYEGDTNGPMGLTHSIGKNKIWETVVIESNNENYSFSEPNVAFDKNNNKFYLLYKQHDKINAISRICFRSKQNTTSIENGDDIIVKNHELYQNYPNPFNNSTNIFYSISQPALVKLSVYNIKGESVKVLINERQNKGQHSIVFKLDNLNSGIYYYRLAVDGVYEDSRKMLYLK
jgi:hypothetical protein